MSGELPGGMGTGMGGGLPRACEAVRDHLGELALGTLTGRERVVAVAHLESCARCSAEVDELAAATDELLHLAPSVEPGARSRTRDRPSSSASSRCPAGGERGRSASLTRPAG
jgi:Putative zinc-finger